MEKEVRSIIKVRRDTTANWELNNPILADGELGFELNDSQGKLYITFKLGDGVTNWKDLRYTHDWFHDELDNFYLELVKAISLTTIRDTRINFAKNTLEVVRVVDITEEGGEPQFGEELTSYPLPKGFSGDYNDLVNLPDIYNKTEVDTKVSDLNTAISDKVSKDGNKVLSDNNYDDEAKDKVDNIPADPKYTDTVTTIDDNLTSTSTTNALSSNQGRLLNINKVDKSGNKVLSDNNYDTISKGKVDSIPANPKYTDTVTSIVDNLTTTSTTSALSANQGKVLNDNKVDKVTGKGLSTNDYDNSSKTKVDNIPANPVYTDTITTVVNNLTTTSTTSALSANQGKILNDNKVDKVTGKGLSTNDYDNTSKDKVDNIPANPKYTDTIVDISGKFDKTGGTFTGQVKAQTNTDYSVGQVRNIASGTALPSTSGFGNGDLFILRKE